MQLASLPSWPVCSGGVSTSLCVQAAHRWVYSPFNLTVNVPSSFWSEGPRPSRSALSDAQLPCAWTTRGSLLKEPKAVTFLSSDLVSYHRFKFIKSLCWAPVGVITQVTSGLLFPACREA